MSTIRLQTNQHRLIENLRHAFNESSMLGELLQNARRAQASEIRITVDEISLTIEDDGSGIADLQTLIHIAESGWSEELQAREHAFGLGILSALYFAEHLTVRSQGQSFSAPTAAIIQGDSIEVLPCALRTGTWIRLDGVRSVKTHLNLIEWVAQELTHLCKAFPLPVWLNGVEVPRPLADLSLRWRETSMGKVLVDLSGSRWYWCCFLQGLPIKAQYGFSDQVVVLPDDTLAKLPDRQHLLNEAEDFKRIQAAVDQAYREALIDAKSTLPASQFIEQHAESCINSSNADLLNDIPCVPRAWFQSWEIDPAGFRRDSSTASSGVISRATLEASGVWRIDTDCDDEPTAEVYLEAANAFLFVGPSLDTGHWLMTITRIVAPKEIRVRPGTTLHRDADPGLAVYGVQLELVDDLHASLEGKPEYAVGAIRQKNTLYLTPNASKSTELICDYVFGDRYDEEREDQDAQSIATFIAVGCSSSADQVVAALLPHALRYATQPKLASATVSLVFDETGKLKAVTA